MPPKKREPVAGPPPETARMIGQRLRQALNILEIEREQLAQIMNVSPADIQKIEQGRRPLPSHWLPQLRRRCGINIYWLLTGVGPLKEEKLPVYLELLWLMQVPEVGADIFAALEQAKNRYKDTIKEAARQGKVLDPGTGN